MAQYRILQDLHSALVGGAAGIPKESRVIFNMLTQHPELKVDGLLYPPQQPASHHSYQQPAKKPEIAAQTHEFIQSLSEGTRYNDLEKFKKLWRYLKIEKHFFMKRYQFYLYPFSMDYQAWLWDQVFSKSLLHTERTRVLEQNFYYSDFSNQGMGHSLVRKNIDLNTAGYDFFLLPSIQPIQVSPQTIKIIRHHDICTLVCPDFFRTIDTELYARKLAHSVSNAVFVCNSEFSRNQLINIAPQLENQSYVVHSQVPCYQSVHNLETLKSIILNRLASSVVAVEEYLPSIHQALAKKWDYILALATLEPRKNYGTLIQAWEIFRARNHSDLKLIIVGNTGWLDEEIKNKMKPHVMTGDLIHLHQVEESEIPYLYSHASLFVSLSYLEGFNSPPVEAMQCGCPVLASDTAIHREIMGDAAFFCDPYDVDSVAESLTELLQSSRSEQVLQGLREQSLKRAQKYSIPNIQIRWHELFLKLKALHSPKG